MLPHLPGPVPCLQLICSLQALRYEGKHHQHCLQEQRTEALEVVMLSQRALNGALGLRFQLFIPYTFS